MTLFQNYKVFNSKKHKSSILQLFREVGWAERDREDFVDSLLSVGKGWVTELDGQAEGLAHTVPGTLRYLQEDLPISCVTAVATSRIARKRGIATHLTAHAIAEDASEGKLVSYIGVFEQGFYDQLGYGTGGYEHFVAFDPAKLRVAKIHTSPKRLGEDDWMMIHQSRLNRLRGHGSVNVIPAEFTRAAFNDAKNGFVLGYFDTCSDFPSHHICISTNNVERGPYNIRWMAYQTYPQFLELLSLLASFGDQIPLIKMHEPPGIQLQDLFINPLKDQYVRSGSKFEIGIRSLAYWQIRICDLSTCLDHTHLSCGNFSFNLILDDPIETYLDPADNWRGLAGEYIIRLGSQSILEAGSDSHLPTLKASIGAFSRMWLGIRPASGLSVSDQLSGPPILIHQLDEAFRHPDPKPDWII
jgi:GNAT superfamily N-acetyltransferase